MPLNELNILFVWPVDFLMQTLWIMSLDMYGFCLNAQFTKSEAYGVWSRVQPSHGMLYTWGHPFLDCYHISYWPLFLIVSLQSLWELCLNIQCIIISLWKSLLPCQTKIFIKGPEFYSFSHFDSLIVFIEAGLLTALDSIVICQGDHLLRWVSLVLYWNRLQRNEPQLWLYHNLLMLAG